MDKETQSEAQVSNSPTEPSLLEQSSNSTNITESQGMPQIVKPKNNHTLKVLVITIIAAAILAFGYFFVFRKFIIHEATSNIGKDMASTSQNKSIQDVEHTKLASQFTQFSTSPPASIKFPEGWGISNSNGLQTGALGPIYTDSTIEPTINANAGQMTYGSFASQIKAELTSYKNLYGELISQVPSLLDGATKVTFEFKKAEQLTPPGKPQSYQHTLIVTKLHNNNLYSVTATSDELQFTKIKPLFEQVIESITYK